MKKHLSWLTALLLAPLLTPAYAAAPLERIPLAPAAQVTGELPGLLREVLGDYQDRLPAATSLRWTERGHSPDGRPYVRERIWSEALQKFGKVCAADKPACAPLLAAQIRTMTRALRESADAPASKASAATLSAVSELCGMSGVTGDCPLSAYLHETAIRWMQLGHDALFVAYLDRYDGQRNQYLEWLKTQGTPPSASTLAALPQLPAWIRAGYFELTGKFSAARELWLTTLIEAVGGDKPNANQERMAAYRLARLSWRLGDDELARSWQQYLAGLPGKAGEAALPCWERHEQWRIDIARSQALREPLAKASETLGALIAADCAYSQALAEYGTDTLIADPGMVGASAPLTRMLAVGSAACKGNCAPARLETLRVLQALAKPEAQELAAHARAAQTRLDQFGGFLETDVQLSWAAAAVVLRQPALKRQGLELLTSLQTHLLAGNDADNFSSFGAQQNRSRFDVLHRSAALAAVQQGTQLELGRLEAMRAQTLLRRLRLSSLAGELAGVRDAPAELHYREVVAAAQDSRRKLGAIGGADARAQAIIALVDRMLDDAAVDARLVLLETLAARKLDGGKPGQSWLRKLGGSAAITELQRKANPTGVRRDLTSLPRDTAYLSWLQVPGGYVASVASFDAEHYPPEAPGVKGGHRQSSRFIAVSAAQEETLGLYRALLMSGAATNRGASRVDVPLTDGAGLRLRSLPVWRTADGSYLAQASAPAGATRAQDLREIGQYLYRVLLEPLHAQWSPAKRLLLSPDGLLTRLPFETLWAGERPLLDVIDVSYVQSLEVHAELARRAGQPRAGGKSLLSFADPDYAAAAVAGAGPVPSWMASLRWNALPGTRSEAEALKPLFPDARQLTGTDAARARVLAMQESKELRDFRILHFATHGYVDDRRSSLVLSTRDGLQQAYLLDSDISTLELRTDLVLLSACDTGLGRSQSGEGVVGLPYAFMLAGNINTLMSLWPVDDAGTAAFMPAFLSKARGGVDLVTALNLTKRDFAAGRYGEKNRDPRIWAAFVQYGVPLQLQ